MGGGVFPMGYGYFVCASTEAGTSRPLAPAAMKLRRFMRCSILPKLIIEDFFTNVQDIVSFEGRTNGKIDSLVIRIIEWTAFHTIIRIADSF